MVHTHGMLQKKEPMNIKPPLQLVWMHQSDLSLSLDINI